MNPSDLKFFLPLLTLLQFNVAFSQNKYSATGTASYYANKFEGRKTASGETYRHAKLTAAHRTLPFGTQLKVTNLENGKSVIVRVNDRGPFVKGRIIDLSKSAAIKIGLIQKGVAKVKVEQVLEKTSSNNSPHTENRNKKTGKNEYYQIEVAAKSLNGFGVQVGCFSQVENLVRTSDAVKKLISTQTYVKVSQINGKTMNRLIVGIEDNRSKAQKHLKKLQRRFPDCFVVKL